MSHSKKHDEDSFKGEEELKFRSFSGEHTIDDVIGVYFVKAEITLICAECKGEGKYDVQYNHPSKHDPFEQAEGTVVCSACGGQGEIVSDARALDFDEDEISYEKLVARIISYEKQKES